MFRDKYIFGIDRERCYSINLLIETLKKVGEVIALTSIKIERV